jgi:hypothetical protein
MNVMNLIRSLFETPITDMATVNEPDDPIFPSRDSSGQVLAKVEVRGRSPLGARGERETPHVHVVGRKKNRYDIAFYFTGARWDKHDGRKPPEKTIKAIQNLLIAWLYVEDRKNGKLAYKQWAIEDSVSTSEEVLAWYIVYFGETDLTTFAAKRRIPVTPELIKKARDKASRTKIAQPSEGLIKTILEKVNGNHREAWVANQIEDL